MFRAGLFSFVVLFLFIQDSCFALGERGAAIAQPTAPRRVQICLKALSAGITKGNEVVDFISPPALLDLSVLKNRIHQVFHRASDGLRIKLKRLVGPEEGQSGQRFVSPYDLYWWQVRDGIERLWLELLEKEGIPLLREPEYARKYRIDSFIQKISGTGRESSRIMWDGFRKVKEALPDFFYDLAFEAFVIEQASQMFLEGEGYSIQSSYLERLPKQPSDEGDRFTLSLRIQHDYPSGARYEAQIEIQIIRRTNEIGQEVQLWWVNTGQLYSGPHLPDFVDGY